MSSEQSYKCNKLELHAEERRYGQNQIVKIDTHMGSKNTAPAKRMTLLKNPLSGGTPANARKNMAMLKAVCGIRLASPLKESRVFKGNLVATAAAATNAPVLTIE